MGYTTEFKGHIEIHPPLPVPLVQYINQMADTRRMKRNLPAHFGIDGEFYVGAGGFKGQDSSADIVDYNTPPSTQPSLWLQWNISPDGSKLEWNGAEKFYNYVEWLAYLYKEIIAPFGHRMTGAIKWRGEDFDDVGKIIVDQQYITADGHNAYDCTPDANPRFIECLKSGKGGFGVSLPRERNEVDRLLDTLDDIADHVEGRTQIQAENIRSTVKKLRAALTK
jgi:hypothetical protein